MCVCVYVREFVHRLIYSIHQFSGVSFHLIFVSSYCYSIFWSVFLSHLRFYPGRLYASFIFFFFKHLPSFNFYFIAHSYFFGYAWEIIQKKSLVGNKKRIENGFYCIKNEFLVSINYMYIPRKKNTTMYCLLNGSFWVVQLLFFTWFNFSSLKNNIPVRLSSTFDFIRSL